MDGLFAKIRAVDVARSDDELRDGGIFTLLFLKRSPLITEEVFPALQERLDCPEFQVDFLTKFRKKLELERERLLSKVRSCQSAGLDPRFYTIQLPDIERKLAIHSMDAYLAFLGDHAVKNSMIIESLAKEYTHWNDGDDGTEYVRQFYPLWQMGGFLFELYVEKVCLFKKFDEPGFSSLAAIYRNHDIDPELQFDKYRLLLLNRSISIVNSPECQTLVDDRINRHLWIDVPRELLAAIESAISNNWVKSISFGIQGISEIVPAFEALEFGNAFNFQALQLPPLSKLYDDEQYDDALWIKVEAEKRPASMTFEELCADFPALDGKVVTQVVHLEFFLEQGGSFISHIDHEYILYSDEEYSRRRFDATVKGRKKLKTFKINDARIPFDFSLDDRYFLYIVLDSYFKNKRLIREYFSRVLSA